MNREYHIEATIAALEQAWKQAVAADLGAHFIAEIDHLIATAKANKESEVKE